MRNPLPGAASSAARLPRPGLPARRFSARRGDGRQRAVIADASVPHRAAKSRRSATRSSARWRRDDVVLGGELQRQKALTRGHRRDCGRGRGGAVAGDQSPRSLSASARSTGAQALAGVTMLVAVWILIARAMGLYRNGRRREMPVDRQGERRGVDHDRGGQFFSHLAPSRLAVGIGLRADDRMVTAARILVRRCIKFFYSRPEFDGAAGDCGRQPVRRLRARSNQG